MPISKRLRFEVLKRDSFTCQYCGKPSPAAILELDHINPRSKGGTDTIDNLITSCSICNIGKSDIELEKAPNFLIENSSLLREKNKKIEELESIINEYSSLISNLTEHISGCENVSGVFKYKEKIHLDAQEKTTILALNDIFKKHFNGVSILDIDNEDDPIINVFASHLINKDLLVSTMTACCSDKWIGRDSSLCFYTFCSYIAHYVLSSEYEGKESLERQLEYSEDMLNGTLCASCSHFIDKKTGYPSLCQECEDKKKQKEGECLDQE